MVREKIINDITFRQRCGKYGLDWNNCEVYGDIILLNTPKKDLYVLLNKDYDTVSIEYNSFCKEKDILAKGFSFEYNLDVPDIFIMGQPFEYPFENFTLKHIIEISNRVQVIEANHGHSLLTVVNGESYDRRLQENIDYFQMLSYIKFLSEEIKLYFLYSYHMITMGFEVPDVYAYVNNLIREVNECINYNDSEVLPRDILSYIGQDCREFKFDGILYDTIDLLSRDVGKRLNLSSLSTKLFEVLDSSEENVNNKENISVLTKKKILNN